LILSGADINEQDTNGWTVLHHACEKGMKEILVEIFKIWEDGKTKRIAINKMTNKNYHILHLAAMNNHPEII
jgi:ankyrin repeat protein